MGATTKFQETQHHLAVHQGLFSGRRVFCATDLVIGALWRRQICDLPNLAIQYCEALERFAKESQPFLLSVCHCAFALFGLLVLESAQILKPSIQSNVKFNACAQDLTADISRKTMKKTWKRTSVFRLSNP